MSGKTQPEFSEDALPAPQGENPGTLRDPDAEKEQVEREQGIRRSRYFDLVSILLGFLANVIIATTGFYLRIGNAVYNLLWLFLLLNILSYYFGTAAIVNHRRLGWIGFAFVLTSISISGMWVPYGFLLSLLIALGLWFFLKERTSATGK